jgi:hypothetical protein
LSWGKFFRRLAEHAPRFDDVACTVSLTPTLKSLVDRSPPVVKGFGWRPDHNQPFFLNQVSSPAGIQKNRPQRTG